MWGCGCEYLVQSVQKKSFIIIWTHWMLACMYVGGAFLGRKILAGEPHWSRHWEIIFHSGLVPLSNFQESWLTSAFTALKHYIRGFFFFSNNLTIPLETQWVNQSFFSCAKLKSLSYCKIGFISSIHLLNSLSSRRSLESIPAVIRWGRVHPGEITSSSQAKLCSK